MELTVLDCTLRDGGYYNHWDFDDTLVEAYLSSMAAAGVEIVEMGFRGFPREGFQGAFAYSTDALLSGLRIPGNLRLAVMVDAKDMLAYPGGAGSAVQALFSPQQDSPVDIVRIAAHFHQVIECQQLVRELKTLGYVVCLNIMQAGGRPAEELEALAIQVAAWQELDVLYFADSLGNMDAGQVKTVVAALRRGWKGALGVHTHNNKSLGVTNALAAMESGVAWLDATVMGMGRGAGNGQTEVLLMELEQRGQAGYHPEQLFQLVLKYFMPLQQKYRWGPGVLYHYAANRNIHPTYIQELLNDGRYSSDDIIGSVRNLAQLNSSAFQRPLLAEARMGGGIEPLQGDWQPAGCFRGQSILILGAGPSLARYEKAIKQFIRQYQPQVMSINIHPAIGPDYVDYYVASQRSRLVLDIAHYTDIEKPMIMPRRLIPEELQVQLADHTVLNYDMQVKPGTLQVEESGCVVPLPLTIAYALCVAIAGDAERVFLAGFDGYPADDPRYLEMVELLELFRERYPQLEPVALTPTTYSLKQGSIYAPW